MKSKAYFKAVDIHLGFYFGASMFWTFLLSLFTKAHPWLEHFFILSFVLIGYGIYFSARYDRCPFCHRHLWRYFYPPYCPNCGRTLDDFDFSALHESWLTTKLVRRLLALLPQRGKRH